MTLKADQILALAPDAASAKAGSQLSGPAKWGNLGRSESALWGECQGSGKDPYRTQIDIGEPAFKCSCPSRKFPCKHGLGLYLLLAAQPALFGAGEPPPWVQDWLNGRQQRKEKKLESAAGTGVDTTPEAAAASAAQARKREEKREQKVARGMAELQTWLEDLAREGLSSVRTRGPVFWDNMAARLVDAQAGSVAARLRRAGGMCFQTDLHDWEQRLGKELASIYLLSKACQGLERLPAPLQHDVRTLIGWNVNQDEVLAEPPVADRWQVLGQRTGEEERVRVRTTWVRGLASARWALLLHYSAGAQGFDKPLGVGTEFDGELCFYPGAWPLRALIRQQSGLGPIAAAAPSPPGFDATLDNYADALAAQPFLERFPMALEGVVPDVADHGLLRDGDGRPIALHPGFRHAWQLLSLSGGHPLTLVGEWDGSAFLPLSAWHETRLYNFESDFGA